MSLIYGYHDKLWKVIHDFSYTGTGVGFTLDADKYLLICKGAKGGITSTVPNAGTTGGVAYGILTLTDPSTQLYAYVGGNGSNSESDKPGVGGFNGGGNGGAVSSSSYVAGAGGGGASDIRIGTDSLYARVIVAGGGGGGINSTVYVDYFSASSENDYSSFGGGPVGGPVISSNTSEDPNCYVYATQTSGYSFGIGMSGINRTNQYNGSSGGGGGWFGGYTCSMNPDVNKVSFASNGGGGSGYVLTADSYKPDGYLLNDKYYLTDIFMNCGCADTSGVIVCKLINKIEAGDTLYFPAVNNKTKITLAPGKYKLKCHGGDGGVRNYIINSARGGYAEGVLTLESVKDVYIYTAGSGISNVNLYSEQSEGSFGSLYNMALSYNGGGSSSSRLSGNGGGASDIRIGTDSLYARVIVAGGGGGASANKGGAGGGETGEYNSAGYGTNSGAGTQTSSPQNTSYTTINGGFGYGGNGVVANGGYGGAGGGGWFGGSGTQPDGSYDDDRGGCGGSGYVLTEESYKPDGYLLDSKYYLTDTVLTTGGNNCLIGNSNVSIDAISVKGYKMLCHDSEGYKYFDAMLNRWVFLTSEEPTEEMFNEYASYNMTSDNGLDEEYDIITYDTDDELDSLILNVIPTKITVLTQFQSDFTVKTIIPDADFDPTVYDLKIETHRQKIGLVSKIYVTISINKKIVSDDIFKLYCIELS